MKAVIEGNELILRIQLETPRPSSSGKTLIVGGSSGTVRLPVQLEGKDVYFSGNAWVKK